METGNISDLEIVEDTIHINTRRKVCSECGHTYEPYSGGTVPPSQVPERETCPTCGKMYEEGARKTWCTCPSCGYDFTHKDFKRQTGYLPPSGPTNIPPGKIAFSCPNCGANLDLYGCEVESDGEYVDWSD